MSFGLPTENETSLSTMTPWLMNTTWRNSTSLNISDVINATGTALSGGPVSRGWLYEYPGPIICVFGVICNIINLVVLTRGQLKDSPYSFLTGLAISDMGLLGISLVHLVMSEFPYSLFRATYDAYIFFVGANICFNSSVWITVLLSIERMLFILRPMTMKSSRKKAWISMAVVVGIVLIFNFPRLFCYEIAYMEKNVYVKGTNFRSSEQFYVISWIHAIFINFIPFLLLIMTNTLLVRAVYRARVKRVSMNLRCNKEPERRRDEIRLTITLICVVFFFFICTFPSAFVDDPISYALFGGSKTWAQYIRSPANQTFMVVSNLLLFCNSSMNFSLYCAVNVKFRKEMVKIFSSACHKTRKYQTNRIRHSAFTS